MTDNGGGFGEGSGIFFAFLIFALFAFGGGAWGFGRNGLTGAGAAALQNSNQTRDILATITAGNAALANASAVWKNSWLLVAARLRMTLTSFCLSCRQLARLVRNLAGQALSRVWPTFKGELEWDGVKNWQSMLSSIKWKPSGIWLQ